MLKVADVRKKMSYGAPWEQGACESGMASLLDLEAPGLVPDAGGSSLAQRKLGSSATSMVDGSGDGWWCHHVRRSLAWTRAAA